MLRFCNSYPHTIWAAYGLVNWDCYGATESDGWWKVEPGECKIAFGGGLGEITPWWFFYAIARDGAQWTGSERVSVRRPAFQICQEGYSDSYWVRMRAIEIWDQDRENLTVNFVP